MALLKIFILIKFMFQVLGTKVIRNGCDSGWDLADISSNSTENCYKFVCESNKGTEWFVAWRRCQELGGELLSLQSIEESDWFRGLIMNKVELATHLTDNECDGWHINAHRRMYGGGLPS